MKKSVLWLAAAFIFMACEEEKTMTVTVSNSLALDRNNEMIEVPVTEISQVLNLPADGQFVIKNDRNEEIPYQVTYDNKVIFAVNVGSSGEAKYIIREGIPQEVPVIACGRHYPERVDDIAWENDLVAFRTYGPALQRTGERAFGYDVWTKRGTTAPVVEERYELELNPETKLSYHVDHGNGLDCYKVGPTLGGGTSALLADGEIVYPYCYDTYEILDNGPLRFTLKLTYNPLVVKNDSNVIESRLISLDAGSHLNKTVITYNGLGGITPIATGIVLHEPDGQIAADAANGYITYVDPTDNPRADNGKIFIGAAFPGTVKEAKPVYFSETEKKEERGGADGHILAISDYIPGTEYVYYWGAGWSKADIKDAAQWDDYVAQYAEKIRNPLTVSYR